MSLDAAVQVQLGDFSLDVRISVAPGEVLAVLGPNGSGKTTLLRALAGLEPLRAGRIVLDERVLDDHGARVLVAPEHRSCGLLFQDHVLFPHLSVCENVAFGLRSRGVPRAEARRRAHDWLELLELSGFADASPEALSRGQAQRVALARTLVTEPRLLLLDEPMASLDVANRGVLRAELADRLGRFTGCTILVTHDPLDVAALADRVVIVEAGRVVQAGTLAEVTTAPGTDYVVELAGALGSAP
jgi:molybdate transport system ATP-binding protein